MCSTTNFEVSGLCNVRGSRSHSAQGLANSISSPCMKIPLPPRLWITDVSDESSDDEVGAVPMDRSRVRSRVRPHKQRTGVNIPIGIFWDIENCQVPRGCSAIDVVAAIRAKFLTGRREADFVVVCDVKKESTVRLQELNDAQVSLIHVCGTQKNAADEKLRQCMRRFGELHVAPAALLLISGDINFAADLSDFRHRKNVEVILVHKQNTSSALIACASSHYCYNELTAHLPRNPKRNSQSEDEGEPTCEIEVANLPSHPPERLSRRLRRLADNCGGKVMKVTPPTAMLKFPTTDHASRALKRMEGEDVFGHKIRTRFARDVVAPAAHTYSSDEGYGTATQPADPIRTSAVQVPAPAPMRNPFIPLQVQQREHAAAPPPPPAPPAAPTLPAPSEWAWALQQLPVPIVDLPPGPNHPKARKITGNRACSASLDQSGCSSSNSADEFRPRDNSQPASRALSPWNSSTFSEQSEGDLETNAEVTVTNLPPYEPTMLQNMLHRLFSQYAQVVRASVWVAADGPLATVVVKSEWDARMVIARVHKKRIDGEWLGRRLELSLGRPSPAPNPDVLRARLRAILLDQPNHVLPLLRLRDAYASRHCCALTTSDIAKVKDTVIIHEGIGRMVQLLDLSPVSSSELEEAPWQCQIHASLHSAHEDGTRILQHVYMEISVLAKHVNALLENHGGILPLLTFVDCYEATFPPLPVDPRHGVALELLLRSIPGVEVKDNPSRHITWRTERTESPPPPSNHSESSWSSACPPDRARTAPSLEPMLGLFERELIDLLRNAARCTIPFSKLIPAFHHHFGRQCRVADYGFTKLPDLLTALSNTIMVLGSGSSRVITISSSAQSRRWTTDLLKLLRAQPGRPILPHDIPMLYQTVFGKVFTPVDYGVCTVAELMQKISPQSIIVGPDGSLSLPRRSPTPEERSRAVHFAVQAVQLLCFTPNLKMEFSRFVPAFHAHFKRQLRVGHYGCVKLIELFEMIPETVTICTEANGDRSVRLSLKATKAVMADRLRKLGPIPLNVFSATYAAQFGASPSPDVMNMDTLDNLIYAVGGCVHNGLVRAPGEVPDWPISMLTACAVLSADRSIASRGSNVDYFKSAFLNVRGTEPNLSNLLAARVITVSENYVRLTAAWRTIWRVAQILSEYNSMTATEIFVEYTKRFEPEFPYSDIDFESVEDFLRHYVEVFSPLEEARWRLCVGVSVPRCRSAPSFDYSIYDTPPGQKGSRVFESPNVNIWCSPPASALPTPTALLTQEKRRTRLAAQFDIA